MLSASDSLAADRQYTAQQLGPHRAESELILDLRKLKMPRQAYVWMAVLLMWLVPVATPAKDMNLIVTLDRVDLQRRIDRMFPITREAELLTVHLHHPRVILHEHSNRIGLRLRLDASVAEQFSVSGSARIDGVLRFASDSGKFYLDHASLKEMQIDGVPSLYLAQVQQLADGVVRDLLQDQAIYTLGQMGESKRIMGSEIKAIRVHNGKMIVELTMP